MRPSPVSDFGDIDRAKLMTRTPSPPSSTLLPLPVAIPIAIKDIGFPVSANYFRLFFFVDESLPATTPFWQISLLLLSFFLTCYYGLYLVCYDLDYLLTLLSGPSLYD